MPRTTAPRAVESPDDAEWLTIGCGWSTLPPGPTHQLDSTSGSVESGLSLISRADGGCWSADSQGDVATPEGKKKAARRSRKKKSRAQGTLLGVAPPHSPAQANPKRRSRIVVPSGVAKGGDAAPALTDGARSDGAQQATVEERVAE